MSIEIHNKCKNAPSSFFPTTNTGQFGTRNVSSYDALHQSLSQRFVYRIVQCLSLEKRRERFYTCCVSQSIIMLNLQRVRKIILNYYYYYYSGSGVTFSLASVFIGRFNLSCAGLLQQTDRYVNLTVMYRSQSFLGSF